MKVLVTGAAGQLGRAIVEEFGRDHEVLALTRLALDVTDAAAVMAVVAAARPAVVVNCAAYNRVDEAEDEALTALDVNALAVRSLARAAVSVGAVLVHYSSDFVFDGTATSPYTEDDQPNPTSGYAVSKLLGEWFTRDVPRHYVLRVESLFGGPAGRGTLDKMIEDLLDGSEVKAFIDRTVSPTYVYDAAGASRALIERAVPAGVYHCVNSGFATWLEVAEEAARLLGRAARLVPIKMADVTLKARRPQFCALSNAKLHAVGISLPPWQEALAKCLAARGLPVTGAKLGSSGGQRSSTETVDPRLTSGD